MFQFFRRMKTLVSSEVNNMIDKAEDPVKMVDEYLREMESEIAEMESTTAKIIAEEKLLARKKEDTAKLADTREEQALKALEESNEDLARRILLEKKRAETEHAEISQLHENSLQQVEDLKTKLNEMKHEYSEMKHKRVTLVARAEAAKAKAQANRLISSVESGSAKRGFNRMEEKIMRQEAEADASEELRETNQSLDNEIKELDKRTEVDAELARLREKLTQKDETKG